MIYYEHHIGDYAAATAHLSLIEDAVYSRLIRRYYLQEGPLPVDVAQVARLAGARSPDERAAVEAVLSEFFVLEADGWHQKRCDEDIARYLDKKGKAQASANARWAKKPEDASADRQQCDGNANACETHDERNALHTPITNHQCVSNETQVKRSRSSRTVSRPEGLTDEVWQDFLAIRKAKKAPLTQTALDGIAREARKARMSLQQALEVCCARGWQGFKADWMAKDAVHSGAQGQGETSYQRSMRERAAAFAPLAARQAPTTHDDPFFDLELVDVVPLNIQALPVTA